MHKEQYLQIFQYLYEFSRLRGKPVRSIKEPSNSYPEIIWLADIPTHPTVHNIVSDEESEDADHWISVKKPDHPGNAPVFEGVPDLLKPWVVEDSLFDDEEFPVLKQEVDQNEVTLLLEDHPEIKEQFDVYMDEQWLQDLEVYQEKDREYQEKLEEYQTLHENYKRFFAVYNKANRFGEEYELVIGFGLLSFGGKAKKAKIYRHSFSVKAEMNFDSETDTASISVFPNPQDLSIHIEDDFIADLDEDFSVEDIRNAETSCKNFLETHEVNFLPFVDKVKEGLQIYINRLSPNARYFDDLSKPDDYGKEPSLYYAPALILRKRNTLALSKTYEQIIQDIKDMDDDFQLNTMEDLLGADSDPISQEQVDKGGPFEENLIYFPKKYNEEQLKIIEKTRYNNKVLVQGPPGTGKSHTIANLISHLLANGQKVLVTAATQRALKVLKDQLPEAVRNLAVNLLGRDNDSLRDLEASVNVINEGHEFFSKDQLSDEIKQKTIRINDLKKILAEKNNQLLSIQEKSHRMNEFNDSYQGTLLEIARKVNQDSIKHEWFKDEIQDQTDFEKVEDINSFFEKWSYYHATDISELEHDFPSPSMLITPERLKEYVDLTMEQKALMENMERSPVDLPQDRLDEIEESLLQMQGILKQASGIQTTNNREVLLSNINQESQVWIDKIQKTEKINQYSYFSRLDGICNTYDITLPTNAKILHLKEDAIVLRHYLLQGNSLSGISFSLKKPFLPTDIKQRLEFSQKIKVNGRPCLTEKQFNSVLEYLDYLHDAETLTQLWQVPYSQADEVSDSLKAVKAISEKTSQLLDLSEELNFLNISLLSSGILLEDFDEDELSYFLQVVAYNRVSLRLNELNQELQTSLESLAKPKLHPTSKELTESIYARDYDAYEEQMRKLRILVKQKEAYGNYKSMREQLVQDFPKLVEGIDKQQIIQDHINQVLTAMHWQHANTQIKYLLQEDSEKIICETIAKTEDEIQDLTRVLSAFKAWLHLLERLEDKQSLKRHLNAWKLAVKKIGKTGRGKKALKFRKEAQEQMENCKEAIPCWIMPLYKVAESFIPRPKMFDYIIVDEASQLGPDAIFLLYLTKKIIIVGDDKQTSPEYVGIKLDTVKAIISKHLQNIPFDNYYGTEFSFFDFASIFCHAGLITLREHFRCMPEIIEFSNRNFYEPDGKQLYPLKQYSANRLEPLKTTHCPDGYIEGRSSHIHNLPEAEAIVSQVGACLNDQRYDGKSIGIICLQGRTQSELLEKLLMDTVGPDEIEKRRIVCGTSASFQGDERDIMFLSLVTAYNHTRSALTKPEDERRFNVAVSRAKEQAWLFHSVQLEDLRNTEDLRYKILDHFQNYLDNPVIFEQEVDRGNGKQPDPFESWFEVDVYNAIVRKGYKVIPQYKVAGGKFRIDLAVILSNGTLIAVECDGDYWHGPEQYQKDMARQKILERCGWQFFRVRGSEFYLDGGKQTMELLWQLLEDNNKNQERKDPTIMETIKKAPNFLIPDDIFRINSQMLFDFKEFRKN